ncbi:unnamed protein product [Spirodela intermedia]|uniref:MI domain-containing protein n=1 Tax=Spirodela intermedia TaxID=51605 RepID=A0A7I8J112_SPIIN|nr:unnamed protein product [Spirodela intermedia]CAA6663493.1 unnamed protein product [Spirodela intermedia]
MGLYLSRIFPLSSAFGRERGRERESTSSAAMAGSRRREEDDERDANGDLSEGRSREADKENGGDAKKEREREARSDRHSGERERESRRSEGQRNSRHREDDGDRRRERDRERDREHRNRRHGKKRHSNGRHEEEDARAALKEVAGRGVTRSERETGTGMAVIGATAIGRKIGKGGEGRREEEEEERPKEVLPPPPPPPPLPDAVANAGRSGGVYIPPFKMAQLMRDVQDKSSETYQRLSWDALRKSINGLVNKVNATNIKNIIPELFSENLIRGRGLFCRSCMKSQMASPGFTDVFAALVAVVNTKFPEVGKLLLRRIVLQLKRAYKRNDKPQLLAATKFIAHLVNQQVAHEIIALELLTVLLENPTDDSVEVAVGFVKECGSLLQDISPQGLHGIFERFRGILHEGEIDKRVQFLIEGLFAIRKAKFQGFPAVRPELDLVELEDQFTHEVSLEDEVDPETGLGVRGSEEEHPRDDESSAEEEESDAGGSDEEDESEEEDEEMMKIKDETETNLVNLRRTIYLTIMSSVDFEEAGHKLLKIKLEPGQEMELCIMLLECCSQERTYLRYYGLLGQRFCMINKVHQENFEKCFVQQYSMIHRLETNKLRNVAKFFAHLLGTDALPWHVLAYIRLTEEDTTSSSRIFIKILFQELSEHLGIRLLNERLSEPTMQDSFESIFPRTTRRTRASPSTSSPPSASAASPKPPRHQNNPPSDSASDSGSDSDSDSDSGSSSSSSSDSDSKTRTKRRKRG